MVSAEFLKGATLWPYDLANFSEIVHDLSFWTQYAQFTSVIPFWDIKKKLWWFLLFVQNFWAEILVAQKIYFLNVRVSGLPHARFY